MPTTLTSVSEPSFSGPLVRFADSLGAAFGTLPAGAQIAFVIAFGLVIGSFLNVVVHRLPIMLERAWRAEVSEATDHAFDDDGLPARYNLWLPRSACPHCGHELRAWENVPVLSYLLLRGRCSHCKTHVSFRYPLLEMSSAALALGALFVLVYVKGRALFPDRGVLMPEQSNTQQVAVLLYGNYMFTFEIASLLLLVAIIGAVVMAKKRI